MKNNLTKRHRDRILIWVPDVKKGRYRSLGQVLAEWLKTLSPGVYKVWYGPMDLPKARKLYKPTFIVALPTSASEDVVETLAEAQMQGLDCAVHNVVTLMAYILSHTQHPQWLFADGAVHLEDKRFLWREYGNSIKKS